MSGPERSDDLDLPADGHAGDLVSAHVDGELDPATDAWVREHLRDCEPCRTAADGARAARDMLRSLPPVDASPVVEGFLARHRSVIRTGTAFVGAAAVGLGALALTSAVLHPAVVPDVDAMVAAHIATREASGAGSAVALSPPALHGMERVRAVDHVGGHYAAPPAVLGTDVRLSRQAMFDGHDLTVVLYRDGRSSVSVFEQPGSLQWDELPDGRIRRVGGRPVWLRDVRPAVMVAEVGDLVVTIVSDDREALTAIVESLPEKERASTWNRLHDACMRFAAAFTAG